MNPQNGDQDDTNNQGMGNPQQDEPAAPAPAADADEQTQTPVGATCEKCGASAADGNCSVCNMETGMCTCPPTSGTEEPNAPPAV